MDPHEGRAVPYEFISFRWRGEVLLYGEFDAR